MGSISKWDKQPLQVILEVELFDIWGMDFLGPFPSLFNHKYILLAVDYVSKWVEAMPTHTNDAKVVENFLRMVVNNVLRKYDVWHRTSLAYHLQTNGYAEVSNRDIKSILDKTVNSSKKNRARKIYDAL